MRVYRRGTAMALSELLPLLDHLGFVALDEQPYTFRVGNERVHLYDIGIRAPEGCRARTPLRRRHRGVRRARPRRHRERRLQPTRPRRRTRRSRSRHDPRLRQVSAPDRLRLQPAVHRGHARPPRQAGGAARPAVQGSLRPRPVRTTVEAAQQVLREQIVSALDAVPSLDEDRICRSFLTLIEATTRTNFFRGDTHVGVQVRPGGDPRTAAAATGVRDLGVRAAGRGGSPPRRADRPRRAAVERPARGLPHRGARADEGADGQERGDRADRGQGRLRRQAAVHRSRRSAFRGRRLLPDVRRGDARPHRQPGRRRGGPSAGHRRPRRRRHLSRRGRRQGHRHVQRHRQQRVARARLLARRRLRVRRQLRLRPQGDGDHGPRRVGERPAPRQVARPQRRHGSADGRRHRRHVR